MEKYKLVGVCFRKCACVSALNSSETSRKPCKSCLSEKTHHDKQQLVMFTHTHACTRTHTHVHTLMSKLFHPISSQYLMLLNFSLTCGKKAPSFILLCDNSLFLHAHMTFFSTSFPQTYFIHTQIWKNKHPQSWLWVCVWVHTRTHCRHTGEQTLCCCTLERWIRLWV